MDQFGVDAGAVSTALGNNRGRALQRNKFYGQSGMSYGLLKFGGNLDAV
jgi:hypothetical protein